MLTEQLNYTTQMLGYWKDEVSITACENKLINSCVGNKVSFYGSNNELHQLLQQPMKEFYVKTNNL